MKKKRPYTRPALKTEVVVTKPPVLLECTGFVTNCASQSFPGCCINDVPEECENQCF